MAVLGLVASIGMLPLSIAMLLIGFSISMTVSALERLSKMDEPLSKMALTLASLGSGFMTLAVGILALTGALSVLAGIQTMTESIFLDFATTGPIEALEQLIGAINGFDKEILIAMGAGGLGALTSVVEATNNLESDKTTQLEKIIDQSTKYMEKSLEFRRELVIMEMLNPGATATATAAAAPTGGGGGGPIIVRLEIDGDVLAEKVVNKINKSYSLT
jgi:hypothetical protein